ncbi:MAG: hypothetical protein HN729_06665 [Candidatus Marinimicrobia bacterium]|jgi:hypothetical protein|nr:hypothetical protein [Candidatus Neomarinimicrobiota bacterium]MBT3633696.1 hypothetical protein [Candidatus Neomarinimicrobiota bacterium]MBT3682351.1 hypothetical protein [Candidatus Neomarinimicrobiota bacterium]MBT3759115.1 hypothetical protein [Candidatus Neomarinimicrobiota bacterium]MBT3895612.1 hypothetical protein [Candidatus Neomarinimicrobiota bacterium]
MIALIVSILCSLVWDYIMMSQKIALPELSDKDMQMTTILMKECHKGHTEVVNGNLHLIAGNISAGEFLQNI